MHTVDISQEKEKIYTLAKNEQKIFFLLNRTGEITFDLREEGSAAYIFAFYIGKNGNEETLRIVQKHSAPRTTSRVSVKSTLSDESGFTYEGLIHIAKSAEKSDASQEGRALLLSPQAKAFTKPALEILTNDVSCRHAATVSPLSPDALFSVKSRGLSDDQAKALLVGGFFNASIEEMEKLGGTIIGATQKLEVALKS